ncbi:unnamed protein product [Protopolystoma xenopodis]|uniref:Uncharacterized protein n=1 Tax=Protopolystoma xenopodis TaxID=117903 RepID=A0A3S4ZJR3_9PLAT|nr:unnamed protein product [Protopolystoma xenopodis]
MTKGRTGRVAQVAMTFTPSRLQSECITEPGSGQTVAGHENTREHNFHTYLQRGTTLLQIGWGARGAKG